MRKNIAILLAAVLMLTGCAQTKKPSDKYRNYYEIFVHSFYDSNDDGIGDIQGVTKKLDYLTKKDGLGIDGIWLMPIMPSPTYHKYDVIDYKQIDPQYGTMEDMDALLKECDKRDVSVIIDLVLNHSSTEHEWFKSAVKSLAIEPCKQEICTEKDLCREHNKYCGYYNFTKEAADGYKQVATAPDYYYECVFWEGMPDLNLDNEDLRAEIVDISKFWLDKGVDGFRLDAVIHFYKENTVKNTEFLNWFTKELKAIKPDAYTVCEAWSNQLTIQEYYKSGVDSMFNFPFSQAAGTIMNAVRAQNGEQLAGKVADWNKTIDEIYPDAIDAPFLTNHDNGRSAGALVSDINMQKIAANIYQLIPGNSFIYYGEEIGMTGSGIDENKRLPMVWGEDKGTTLPPQNAEAIEPPDSVAAQEKDPLSLLNHYKKLIAAKNKYPQIQRGVVTPIEISQQDTSMLSVYKIEHEGKSVIIAHNLSREQAVTVTLSKAELGYNKLGSTITSNADEATLDGETLTIPLCSSVILE